MSNRIARREFLSRSAIGGAAIGLGVWSSSRLAASASPNEKLNIGVIGTANQARFSIDNVKQENIVAVCDIDDDYLAKAKQDFPQASTYNDFRKLLDQHDIDAVVVAVPDHVHAPATAAALHLGKHVYCEKPLTHTIAEARAIAELAAKMKVATQMGTQIHAGENYRRVVEIIQSGAVGKVSEVHTWAGRAWGGGDRPKETPPIPPSIHWDLWLGPAPARPYHPTYLPQNWRKWWDFGGGNIADMACHHMDLPFWALGIRHPAAVEAIGPPVHPETCPLGLVVRYEYAADGPRPVVKLTWYDGTSIPPEIHGHPTGGGGNLFVGDKGMLWADYDRYDLYPKEDFKDYKPPERSIPRSIGHHAEWILACKTGTPTTCNFGYAGPLTEAVLLGNVAYRTGKRIEWDPDALKATNSPEAERYLRTEYRKGWTL
ncbi:MAG TPA: Gfo/Idh/MocA family oxidoreductase [Pirellulales bacterium]|jgi:predicted dehydrogenase|nr:Gfo/Idh/MocA family oxidoreductase [Pirellulales bacterium]